MNIGETFLGNFSLLRNPGSVSTYVAIFVSGAISVAGVILLFILIIGGIGIMAGAGNNDPQQIEKGKKAATSALIGFIVVFVTYWIVELIQNITGLPLGLPTN